jgi:hypothetical protein
MDGKAKNRKLERRRQLAHEFPELSMGSKEHLKDTRLRGGNAEAEPARYAAAPTHLFD